MLGSGGTNLHNGRTSECPSHVQDHRSYIVMTQSLTLAKGTVQEIGEKGDRERFTAEGDELE